MRIAKGTWVLLADGERYLVLRNEGGAGVVDLRVIAREEQENPPNREQGTDRPGRLDDPGPGRSAVEETDWHRMAKERFARDLAERLRLWALGDRFEALVVAADPRTLGVLRPALHKAVLERLVGEVDKDLTGMPLPAVTAILEAA